MIRMRISKAWTVSAKDLTVFMRKRSAVVSMVLFPLIVSVGLPLVVHVLGARHEGIAASTWMPTILDAFSFFFIIGSVILPTTIAAYSLVGEKLEKSLEPLLAAPVTDGEILLGKSIAAFIPPMAAIYIGAIVFMALIDVLTHHSLGYWYFPNWTIGLMLLLVAPLSAILSIEMNVIVSSRASDVRAAQLQANLVVIPFAAIYVASEVGVISLDIRNLLIISAVILILDLALFFVSTKIFQREEILTKWT
jgi:ABC-2 type transport system permease protein